MREVFVTGNTVIDAIDVYFDKVREVEAKVVEQIKFGEYALATFHRLRTWITRRP
jgi:UDP-N-acetylglucosamine 2-epimerase (non-hydrolysing)